MLCVLILYISGGAYSLKSTPNDRFEKLFMAILICWEEIAEEILFVFRLDVWPGTRTNPGFSSNKPTHYLLDHGDNFFIIIIWLFVIKTTEHIEWTRDFDVYWQIMKGTVNITKKKKYFCLYLNLSVLFIYVLLIFGVGFYHRATRDETNWQNTGETWKRQHILPKKYFCLCLIFSILFIYFLLIYGMGFYFLFW